MRVKLKEILREKKPSSTSIVSWPLNSATDPKVSAPLLPCTSCEGSRDRVLSACMIGTWCFRCFRRLRLLHIPLRVNCELNQRKWDKLNWVQDQPTNLLKWSVRSNFLSELIKLVWFPSLIGPQDSVNPWSNQIQNGNQARQRHTSPLFTLSSHWFFEIFSYILIGSQPCCRFTGAS